MPKNNGQITVATAKKRFVEYYDNNRNKKNGKERGKKLDMMYKKKPAFSCSRGADQVRRKCPHHF